MSIWNKVLVGLIGVASLVLFYMAARTLKTHQHWRELAGRLEQKIDQVRQDNVRLAEGAPNAPGIRQLRVALNKLLVDRRRMWRNCQPNVSIDREAGTAAVTLQTEQTAPHGIAPNTVLYAFEQSNAEKQGHYLGQFNVTQADQQRLTLSPTSRLSDREIQTLAAARGPWTLYELMPQDNREVFAALSEEQKKALLPAASLPEFLKDGGPAAEGDPTDRIVEGKYVRTLRDYQVLLGAVRVARTLLIDRIDAATRDKKLVEDALALARQQEEAVQAELASAKREVEEFARQRDAVAAYRRLIERELESVRAAIARLIENNQAMAGQIAKLQSEATRRIDQRTRAMARNGIGG